MKGNSSNVACALLRSIDCAEKEACTILRRLKHRRPKKKPKKPCK